MGDRIVRMGVGLLVGVWLARYLGPSLYGEFNYAFAFAMMFAPVAMLGLDEIGIRELIKDPSNRDEILGTAFLPDAFRRISGFFTGNCNYFPGPSRRHAYTLARGYHDRGDYFPGVYSNRILVRVAAPVEIYRLLQAHGLPGDKRHKDSPDPYQGAASCLCLGRSCRDRLRIRGACYRLPRQRLSY